MSDKNNYQSSIYERMNWFWDGLKQSAAQSREDYAAQEEDKLKRRQEQADRRKTVRDEIIDRDSQ